MRDRRKLALVGLGYVGLPVAVAFGGAGFSVVAYDTDRRRIDELRCGRDRTKQIAPAEIKAADLRLTSEPTDLQDADFFVITVPTPIDRACVPDLSLLLAASRTVGAVLREGAIVVYES